MALQIGSLNLRKMRIDTTMVGIAMLAGVVGGASGAVIGATVLTMEAVGLATAEICLAANLI